LEEILHTGVGDSRSVTQSSNRRIISVLVTGGRSTSRTGPEVGNPDSAAR